MDKIFIRERLNIVDYNNNNQGLIYTSSDADITGGALNITLESDVGGWHQLAFDMPAYIMDNGKQILNPLTKDLFPLSKIQYTRVTKEGNDEKELILYFIVQPQDNTRDDNGIILYHYDCVDYPRHNLSKAKNGITIGEDTIDEKRSLTPNNEIMNVDGRICYVEAPVQWREFNNYSEIGLWGDAKPGAFAWVKGTKKGYRLTGVDVGIYDTVQNKSKIFTNWIELEPEQSYHFDKNGNVVPEPVWCPDWGGYPLEPDVNGYEYGDIGVNDINPAIVQFYWDTLWLNPDKTVGRYDGLLYQTGSRLLYNVYETLNFEFPPSFLGTYHKAENLEEIVSSYVPGTTAYVLETGTVWRYTNGVWENTHQTKREAFKTEPILKGDWSKLDPLPARLAPNTADKYLDYILEGTGWTVGTVDTILIDNGTIEMDQSGVVTPGQVELRTDLFFDNSNAYNAITELCDAFKCYPRFDHVNKTVSLKAVPGDDYGLVYQWRDNLATTKIVQDGEKAVSKLWVRGGEDLNSEVTIADCNRMNPNYYLADYTSLADLQSRAKPIEGSYAKVTTRYTWGQISKTVKEVQSLENLPATGSLGQMYFVEDQNSYWAWFPEGNAWYDTYQETPSINSSDEIAFEQRYDYIGGKWVNKGQFYHWYETVSPFGDNYIMNFDYFVDRKLMTEEQVEDIKYNYVLLTSRLNKKIAPLFNEYNKLSMELLTWNNTYDSCKIARDAIDKTLRTTYAIYETNAQGLITVKELDVNAYPPGADIQANNKSKGNTGWVESNIVYSDSDAVEVSSYTAISTRFPNPVIGDMVKVRDEVKVYYYNQPFKFEDTICAYLGYTSSDQVKNKGFDNRNNELLHSPDGSIEARVRNEGLFQRFRDEELANDAERAVLAPWYNPPANINEVPAGPIGDPTTTSLMHTYYDSQNRYVTEQMNMNDALDRIAAIETQLTFVMEKLKLLQEQVNKINRSLREKYGDFIVEGEFADDSICYIYNLWYAGIKALTLYHRPLVTYELGVVDISGLPEYRTVTSDIYHDIVYRMNQAELVLPSPGDYCYVTDNTLGMVMERANVTSITRNLSNPSQHSVTIATVDTNTEDLIGKLVTAANTIYSKEQIYNRSAIIKQDGTIAQDSMMGSLEDNSGQLAFMSNSGTVVLTDNGITTIDRDDSRYRMQYTGKGIFSSTNAGATWDNILNAGKISIKSLSAGTIDSNVISVSNIGYTNSIIIDGKGISAVNYDTDVDLAPTNWTGKIDETHTAFFLDALTGNAYFRGMIRSGAGEIGGWTLTREALHSGSGNTYTAMSSSGNYAFWAGAENPANAKFSVTHSGELKATGTIYLQDGSVGGWDAGSNGLSTGGTGANGIYISANGISGITVHDHSGPWTLYSKGNFGVTTAGILHASGACIRGKIVITDSSSEMNEGKVGGWDSTKNGLIDDKQNPKLVLSPAGNGITAAIDDSGTRSDWGIYMNGRFGVTTGGVLYAKEGHFSGTITANSGSIAGWNISQQMLQKQIGNYSFEIRSDRGASEPALLIYQNAPAGSEGYRFYVRPDGYMYCSNATIYGSGSFSGNISASTGNIGGWSLSNGVLTGGTISAGHIEGSSLSLGSLEIGEEGWMRYRNEAGTIIWRMTRYGNMYIGTTDTTDIKDQGTNAALKIMNTGNIDIYGGRIKFRYDDYLKIGTTEWTGSSLTFEQQSFIAAYGNLDGSSRVHGGLTVSVKVDISDSPLYGTCTLYFCKGLYVGKSFP